MVRDTRIKSTLSAWQLSALLVLASACRPPGPGPGHPLRALATDRDGDGWDDPIDRCPTESGNFQGCDGDPDPDRDNVVGARDRCPEVAGAGPDGCQPPDDDGDGIREPDDRCPDSPESVNGHDDHDGCPDEPPVQTPTVPHASKGTYYPPEVIELRAETRAVLDADVAALKEYPRLMLEIVCHEAKERGTKKYGPAVKKLTQRRADRIKKYITAAGIASERITARGAGWQEPVPRGGGKEAIRNQECVFLLSSSEAPATP